MRTSVERVSILKNHCTMWQTGPERADVAGTEHADMPGTPVSAATADPALYHADVSGTDAHPVRRGS
jgi:hypothetical protein